MTMIVYSSKKETITLEEKAFSSGGEGEIRKVVSAPPRFHNVCVKIYYVKQRTKEKENKIRYMISNPPMKVADSGFMLGWPLDYVTDEKGAFLGFIMPLAFPDSKQLVTLTALKLSTKLDDEWYIRYDRKNGKYALVSRLKLICNIAIPLHILHSTGKYILKDIKPENILVTCDGKVSIVDMDSVQIAEKGKLLYPGEVMTPNYMPPEYHTKGIGKNKSVALDKSWDNFSIGVVFYQLLFGLHPYVVTPYVEKDDCNDICQNIADNLFPFGSKANKIKGYPDLHNKFRVLPKEIQDLFVRAFSSNESQRPSVQEWGKCIHSFVSKVGPLERPEPPKDRPKPPVIPPKTVFSDTMTPPLPPPSSDERQVFFLWAFSYIFGTHIGHSRVYTVKKSECLLKYSWPYLLGTFLFGWWNVNILGSVITSLKILFNDLKGYDVNS